jgi:adenylate cyclase class IV
MIMETEIKIEIDREKKITEIYEALGKPDWNIQRNYFFRFNGNILRLRYEAGKAFLTAKGKDNGERYNQRPEIECEIPADFFMDFAKLRGGSSELGYYEKSRASGRFMNCIVCLDNFFGTHYCEVEGREEDLQKVIEILRLGDFPVEKRSYLELLGDECSGRKSS